MVVAARRLLSKVDTCGCVARAMTRRVVYRNVKQKEFKMTLLTFLRMHRPTLDA